MSDDVEHVPLPTVHASAYTDNSTREPVQWVWLTANDYLRVLDDREQLAFALEQALVPLGAIDLGVTWELHPDLKAAVRDAVVIGLASLSHVRGIR